MFIGAAASVKYYGIALMGCSFLVAHVLVAAEPQPGYPHTNPVTWYQVDARWPKHAESLPWGAVSGVAVDKADQIWVFARAKPPVRVYDEAGQFIRGWGDDVVQMAHGLRLDADGNVWLSDIGNHVVMQFTPEGKLLKILGTRGVAGEDPTHMNKPTDMAISPTGEVFVADGYVNNRIVHFDRDGRFVKAWGTLGHKPGQFSLPHAIVRDSKGRLYVADRNNARIQIFDENGTFLDEWRNLLVPWGLHVTDSGDVWACGSSPMPWIGDQRFLGIPPKDQVVMRFSSSGRLLFLWTLPLGARGKEQAGEVNLLHSITMDSRNNIYLGDILGQRIQKFVMQDAVHK